MGERSSICYGNVRSPHEGGFTKPSGEPNGQTEGHINKLKLLKRSMYGRANFDLLRRRMSRAS
jgi:hypothetical protein